jgi:hypothetical protein
LLDRGKERVRVEVEDFLLIHGLQI